MHPYVHRRAAGQPKPEVLPTRAADPVALASFANRNIRGEVMRDFQEAARQRA